MIIDLVALAMILGFAYLGWRSGLMRQFVHMVALAAAAFLAPPLGVALTPHVELYMGSKGHLADYTALFIAWLILFVVFDVMGLLLFRVLKNIRSPSTRKLNLVLGAITGGLKGATIVLVLGTGMFLLRGPLGRAYPPLREQIAASYTIKAVANYNPLMDEIPQWARNIKSRKVTPPRRPAPEVARPKPLKPPTPPKSKR